jgi:hypothetical protein
MAQSQEPGLVCQFLLVTLPVGDRQSLHFTLGSFMLILEKGSQAAELPRRIQLGPPGYR